MFFYELGLYQQNFIIFKLLATNIYFLNILHARVKYERCQIFLAA